MDVTAGNRPALFDMPLYEYRCEKCGHQFEIRQSYDAVDLTEHECGGILVKLVSLSALIFKGSGWTEKTYK